MKRGDYEVILSETIFINDGEVGKIDFAFSGEKRAHITIKFEPMDSPPVHPPISVTGPKYTKTITFSGWNSHQVYSAKEPLMLFKLIGPASVYFSACNTYLGGTNMLHIEFYWMDY
jgi:hypothetical protein